MSNKNNAILLCCICFLLIVVGCNLQSSQTEKIVISPIGVVAEEPQRSGDPVAGYHALLNNPYVSCGIPYSAYARLNSEIDEKLQLTDRPGRNAELPYMLTAYTTADNVELVVSNCLSCHASFFNDELIIGLGDETADWTADLVVAAEGVGAYITTDPDAKEWRRWADRMNAIAPYVATDTIGVNPANNLTLALIAHHDAETLAWSPKPLLDPPPEKPLPVSVPPWWLMEKKHALFYSTEGRGDHARFMMTAALFCTDTVAEAEEIDAYFTDIHAYITSLQAPEYPFPVDDQLAAQGQSIFEKTCTRCHGEYGEQERYPNLVLGLDEIGTDPELARSAVEDAGRFIEWYNSSFFGDKATVAPALGYIAPPLDGVWATAPYLHNGSVPSIAVLLNSTQRPQYWRRNSLDSTDYDQQNLGWHYTELDYGKAGAANREERKLIYDTTLLGYANQGHTFGDHLTDAERRAVLEYLKTL